MFADLHALAETQRKLSVDLCIIGAGAAGIALACEFIDSPVSVCLLDATMNMFLAKTQGASLVQVRVLGEIAPEPGCK